MERTLEPEQYVLVDKLTPRFDAYKRGDIVVFKPPADWGDDDTPFIKRVIGEGGDTIDIRDGHVFVNEVRARRALRLRRGRRARRRRPMPRRGPDHVDDPGRRGLPDGRPPLQLRRFADLRPDRGRPGHRSRLAALLAARHVRRSSRRRPTRNSRPPLREPPVNPFLAVVALAVVGGAVAAVSIRDVRAVVLGASAVAVASPLVADPVAVAGRARRTAVGGDPRRATCYGSPDATGTCRTSRPRHDRRVADRLAGRAPGRPAPARWSASAHGLGASAGGSDARECRRVRRGGPGRHAAADRVAT